MCVCVCVCVFVHIHLLLFFCSFVMLFYILLTILKKKTAVLRILECSFSVVKTICKSRERSSTLL